MRHVVGELRAALAGSDGARDNGVFGYDLRAWLRAKDVDAAAVPKQPVAACKVNDKRQISHEGGRG